MTTIKMVEEFHRVFGHPVSDRLILPSIDTQNFRHSLVEEEAGEGLASTNIVELADALGDMQYVLDGWFLVAGLQDKKQAILEEIHASNMSKSCATEEEAQKSIDALVYKDGTLPQAYHYEPVGNRFIVYRSADRKVMKSVNYFKPNLQKIIEQ